MASTTDTYLRLSGSTKGAAIALNADSNNPTLIHTATNDPTQTDHLELFASNAHSADVQITIVWAGGVETGPLIPFQKGAFRVCPPRPIWGGETVKIYASVAGVIQVWAGSATTRSTTN